MMSAGKHDNIRSVELSLKLYALDATLLKQMLIEEQITVLHNYYTIHNNRSNDKIVKCPKAKGHKN